MAEMSDTTAVHLYLKERGPGFKFTSDELKVLCPGVGAFSAALWHMNDEGRVAREVVCVSGRRPMFKYIVLEGINADRPLRNKPKQHTSARPKGLKRSGMPNGESLKPIDLILSEVFDRIVEISERSKNPLREFTDMQLLEELTRRQKRPGIEALVEKKS